MGDNVSLSNALIVALFSIIVVFFVLILISILIGLLKGFSGENKIDLLKEEVLEEEEPNDEELVAVIAAAVAASLGLNIPDINIKSIRRVPQNSIAWSEMAKKEQLLGRL